MFKGASKTRTHDPSDDPFDHSRTFHRMVPPRDRLMSRKDRVSEGTWGGCCGTSAAVFTGQRIQMAQSEWGWTAGFRALVWQVWVTGGTTLFFLLCWTVTSSNINYLRQRGTLMRTCSCSLLPWQPVACAWWLAINSGVMDWKALSSESLFDPL